MKRNSSKNADHSAKKHCGFTLVELVVVIAVLAILAGVGAVAYKGYIKHAKEAADLELLSAVNTAYQSACMDEGMKAYPVEGEVLLSGELGAREVDLDNVFGKDNVSGNKVNMKDSFSKYYKGNEEKSFKTYEKLIYMGGGVFAGQGANGLISLEDGTVIAFKDTGDGYKEYTVKGKGPDGTDLTYKVSSEWMDKYARSTFGKDMSFGELLDDVDKMTKFLGRFFTHFDGTIAESFGLNDGLAFADSGPYKQTVGRSAIFLLAERSTADDFKKGAQQKIKDYASGKISSSSQMFSMNSLKDGESIANMSTDLTLAYAMATSYANSDYAKSQTIKDGNSTQSVQDFYLNKINEIQQAAEKSGLQAITPAASLLSGILQSEGFKEYYFNESGEANERLTSDLDGYFSAMDFITENKDTLKDGNGMVKKGLSSTGNPDLGNILDGIFK